MSTTSKSTNPAVKVRRDLAEIIDLSVQLLTQAIHDANAQVDGHSLPGGRAMIALASVGDVETFERRVELSEAAWVARAVEEGGVRVIDGVTVVLDDTSRPTPAAEEDDDSAPALQILRYWSERYRWQLGMVWDLIPTIQTEAAFLRSPDVLTYIAERRADEWPHMARDINRARQHLESVLHAGRRPDRSRVVCNNPTCETPRQLIHVPAPRFVVAWDCHACGTRVPEVLVCDRCHHASGASGARTCNRMRRGGIPCGGTLATTVGLDRCPNPWCWSVASPDPVWESSEDQDRWKCTACKTWYDETAFKRAHADQLLDETTERYVLLPDAIDTLKYQGRASRTIRKWLESPIQHVADQCTLCRRRWPAEEHNVCPAVMVDHGQIGTCGGELKAVKRGDPDDVVGGYCEIGSRRVWVWWPDLWEKHLNTKTRRRTIA